MGNLSSLLDDLVCPADLSDDTDDDDNEEDSGNKPNGHLDTVAEETAASEPPAAASTNQNEDASNSSANANGHHATPTTTQTANGTCSLDTAHAAVADDNEDESFSDFRYWNQSLADAAASDMTSGSAQTTTPSDDVNQFMMRRFR